MLVALCCWQAGGALAQVSGSVAFVSDYRYRGLSLSNGDPVPQINIAYDGDGGWYVGAFASQMKSDRDARAQVVSYAGYAWRMNAGMAWDVGVSHYAHIGEAGRNYPEVQVGVSWDKFNARLSYSPDYGVGDRTLYAEAGANVPVYDGVYLFAHLGHLRTIEGAPAWDGRYRNDARIGLATTLAGWKWQLAWDGARFSVPKNTLYGTGGSRTGVVLSATHPF